MIRLPLLAIESSSSSSASYNHKTLTPSLCPSSLLDQSDISTPQSPHFSNLAILSMVKYSINHTRFLCPLRTLIEDGGPHRLARRTICGSGKIPKSHENYDIAIMEEVDLNPAQINHIMHMIGQYIQAQARKHV